MSIPSTFRGIFLSSAAAAILAVASCGHPSTGSSGSGGSSGTTDATDCTPGTHLCACAAGNTCNPGLACADDVNKCVVVASATGSGGATTSGGSTGSGGTIGSGGSTGSSGGSTGSGGMTGNGGSPGSGGSGPSGPNLVMNGDLSQGDAGWNIGSGSPSSSGVVNGQYCATANNGSGTVLIGWGGTSVSANLMANVSYTLSYQASTTGQLSSFDVHVGSAVQVPPGSSMYPIDQDFPNDSPAANPATFTHPLSLTKDDPQAGVAFIFSVGSGTATVCIDNVTIASN